MCLGEENEMLGAVEDPETLKSFAKFAQVLWRSAFLPICNPCLLFLLSPNLHAATLFPSLLFLDLL